MNNRLQLSIYGAQQGSKHTLCQHDGECRACESADRLFNPAWDLMVSKESACTVKQRKGRDENQVVVKGLNVRFVNQACDVDFVLRHQTRDDYCSPAPPQVAERTVWQ